MPKVPRGEFSGFDPDSEEYAPSMEEIEEDESNAEQMMEIILEVEKIVASPGKTIDEFDNTDPKFVTTDPQDIFDRLARASEDYLSKIKDPEIKSKLEVRLKNVEKTVYRHYIPFIETQINTYGLHHSPLEKKDRRSKISTEEIDSHFEQAKSELKRFKISGDELVEFISELERLQGKLERYQNEPTLFTFESIEEKLQEEIGHTVDNRFIGSVLKRGQSAPKGLLYSDQAHQENIMNLEALLKQARRLMEIASQMQNQKIQQHCKNRAQSILNFYDGEKIHTDLPGELLAIEGEIKTIAELADDDSNKESLIAAVVKRLEKIPSAKLDPENLETYNRIKNLSQRLAAGKKIDSDERFNLDKNSVNWAWDMLGIQRGATAKEIRKAYHTLAKKYHAYTDGKLEMEEEMKQINEAYDLIRKIMDFR